MFLDSIFFYLLGFVAHFIKRALLAFEKNDVNLIFGYIYMCYVTVAKGGEIKKKIETEAVEKITTHCIQFTKL